MMRGELIANVRAEADPDLLREALSSVLSAMGRAEPAFRLHWRTSNISGPAGRRQLTG